MSVIYADIYAYTSYAGDCLPSTVVELFFIFLRLRKFFIYFKYQSPILLSSLLMSLPPSPTTHPKFPPPTSHGLPWEVHRAWYIQ